MTQEREALTDEQIVALNAGERFFSESPTKYPEAGHGTQYHCGLPGLLGFARAVAALAAAPVAEAPDVRENAEDAMKDALLRGTGVYSPATPQAASAPVGGAAWQPIATAPRDGSKIILWWGGYSRYGSYLDNSHTSVPWAGWKVPSLEAVPTGTPTHWMPMPKGPAS